MFAYEYPGSRCQHFPTWEYRSKYSLKYNIWKDIKNGQKEKGKCFLESEDWSLEKVL